MHPAGAPAALTTVTAMDAVLNRSSPGWTGRNPRDAADLQRDSC
jgi:hypothetical protein